jgi:hypothetical protein
VTSLTTRGARTVGAVAPDDGDANAVPATSAAAAPNAHQRTIRRFPTDPSPLREL